MLESTVTSPLDDVSNDFEALDLEAWLPFRCSVISNRVSNCLKVMYAEKYGMTVPGWRVMAALGKDAPLSAKEVAERTPLDQVQVTRAINQLAQGGLISRRTDPVDRRRIVLKLSQKGVRAYREIVPVARSIEQALLANFSPEEREQLDKLTLKLTHVAEKVISDNMSWTIFCPEDTIS